MQLIVPTYYGGQNNPYEAIKVIESWGCGFSVGNALKYISRAGKKDLLDNELVKSLYYIKRASVNGEKCPFEYMRNLNPLQRTQIEDIYSPAIVCDQWALNEHLNAVVSLIYYGSFGMAAQKMESYILSLKTDK